MKKVTLLNLILLFGWTFGNVSFIEKNKEELKTHVQNETVNLGFLKILDMAPLAIAFEKGYFKEEGLEVNLLAYPNWKFLMTDVIKEKLSGAMVFTSQSIACQIGIIQQGDVQNVCGLGYIPASITLSNQVWKGIEPNLKKDKSGNIIRPFSSKVLQPLLDSTFKGEMFRFGMTYPVSTENYHLRYWLAEGRINPGHYTLNNRRGDQEAQVQLSVTPPPYMPKVIEHGTLNGYMTSEPWGQEALSKKVGIPILSSFHIQSNMASKSLALSSSFIRENKETSIKVVKAIIKACVWLDQLENREEAITILSNKKYVGASKEVLEKSFGLNYSGNNNEIKYDINSYSFYKNGATFPYQSDAVWLLTQMRRWGQITENKSDKWYNNLAKKTQNNELWYEAINRLKKDENWKSKIDEVDEKKKYDFIGGSSFNQKKPNHYLSKFVIGFK